MYSQNDPMALNKKLIEQVKYLQDQLNQVEFKAKREN